MLFKMPKIAFYASIVIGALLFVPTVYLAVVNWSPKVFQPLLSVVFGGVVTAFIALSFILRQTTISERFPVYVVLDQQTNLPPIVPWERPHSAFDSMSRRANLEEFDPGKFKQREVIFKSPDEKFEFYAQLIQYELVVQMYGILRYVEGISQQTSATKPTIVSVEVFDLKRPKRFTKIEGQDLIKALSHNRFLQPSEKRFWEFQEAWLPLPYKTTLSIPDSRSLILERPGYYKVTLKIDPVGAGQGSPLHLVDKFGNSRVETLGFIVTTEAVFEKFTSGSPYSEESMDWVRSLFNRLKIEFFLGTT